MQRERLKSCLPAEAVKNLGVWFDSDFSFSKHVRSVCKVCFLQIRDLRRLRQYLTRDAAVLAANALVSSRLDYCNSMFRSLSGFNVRKLQCVQNSLARIVTNTNRFSHITPALKSLHWLPIEQRSVFKTATMVYKFLQTGYPRYFGAFLNARKSVYNTRSSQREGEVLEVPQFIPSVHKSTRHFGFSFAYDAPKVWNELPDDIRSATSLLSFRKKLKSYLFAKAFPP